ncbi:Regulatory protein LuxO [Planctomycetes bacterium Pla163]|uniref:Regulatory protein LuxO n=1 Tax=Rohdeia mirabilis TaxID=2528008 RepID=A0A518CV63_9BACT|nr:Regulatory protein LuxO [Planctomycetes bacterium Pla163]
MTSPLDPLAGLLPLALDMTASLSAADRRRRLVEAVTRALPCDCAALLRLEGDVLVPVAAIGLLADLMGRRFRRGEHPRLDIICTATDPTRFPADSPLADPYDGLVEGATATASGGVLTGHVHSCLGCPLIVEGELVGVLTVDALRVGAFDSVGDRYLEALAALAGASLRTSDLIETLERTAERQRLVANELVRDALASRGATLVGASDALTKLRREIELVAPSDFGVLVTGETGVGKELVVRMLHAESGRADRPLVTVNAAALPESIVESELFGHVRGAFTGAETERLGAFAMADGASLFLDEIGELPLHVQPKLLRVLQEGEFMRVGSDAVTRVDVRVLAATNRDLEEEVRAGRFRADLLHRLDVCRITVPPLRERAEDVAPLAGHFADANRARFGTGPVRFAADAQRALTAAAWPGNVRELENTVARAVLHASSRVERGESVLVKASDLGRIGEAYTLAPVVASSSAGGMTLAESVAITQRASIERAVAANAGNWAAAARELGVDRANLHRLARRLGVK